MLLLVTRGVLEEASESHADLDGIGAAAPGETPVGVDGLATAACGIAVAGGDATPRTGSRHRLNHARRPGRRDEG